MYYIVQAIEAGADDDPSVYLHIFVRNCLFSWLILPRSPWKSLQETFYMSDAVHDGPPMVSKHLRQFYHLKTDITIYLVEFCSCNVNVLTFPYTLFDEMSRNCDL